MDITDEDVAKTLEEMRERAATFAPVEGRTIQDGDFAQVKLIGTPEGGGDPLQAESVLCHIGAEETMEPFNTNLKGASAGDHKNFVVDYPADYPDPKLAGKKYHYAVEVLGIKTKKLPELNDDFAKDVSDTTRRIEEKKVREGLEHQRDHKHKGTARRFGGGHQAARLPYRIAGGASNGCAAGARGALPCSAKTSIRVR
jgi:trigger factor